MGSSSRQGARISCQPNTELSQKLGAKKAHFGPTTWSSVEWTLSERIPMDKIKSQFYHFYIISVPYFQTFTNNPSIFCHFIIMSRSKHLKAAINLLRSMAWLSTQTRPSQSEARGADNWPMRLRHRLREKKCAKLLPAPWQPGSAQCAMFRIGKCKPLVSQDCASWFAVR